MKNNLQSLISQMEEQLWYLKPKEKQMVKNFIVFAYERGESSMLEQVRGKK